MSKNNLKTATDLTELERRGSYDASAAEGEDVWEVAAIMEHQGKEIPLTLYVTADDEIICDVSGFPHWYREREEIVR